MKQENVPEVKNLQTYFYSSEGVAKAVDGVSFTLQKEKHWALLVNLVVGNP